MSEHVELVDELAWRSVCGNMITLLLAQVIHTGEHVGEDIELSRNMPYPKQEVLQVESPAYNDSYFSTFNPQQVSMICFDSERLASKIVIQ